MKLEVNELRGNRSFFFYVLLCAALAAGLCACAGPKVAPTSDARREYVVDGKRYRVMGSSEGYSRHGAASWYGDEFHGRKTASGEVYDMEAMTAAHRTLPLGTYVRVRRTDGRGDAVVKVNDRGPFVEGRIIDLSRAAARRLGMLGEGVAEVEVTALGERDARSTASETVLMPRADYGTGSFAVQVGAFTVRDNAERLASAMRGRYSQAEVQRFDRGDAVFFRVWVGRFVEEGDADRFRSRLLSSGEVGAAFVVGR